MRLQLREHIKQIISLSDEEYNFVFSHFTEKNFVKHQYIVQQGDNVDKHHFILEGLMKASNITWRYPSLTEHVPKTMIASYLGGVSRETLSRLTHA